MKSARRKVVLSSVPLPASVVMAIEDGIAGGIRRPTIEIIIDPYTRCVLGWDVRFEDEPSSLAISG